MSTDADLRDRFDLATRDVPTGPDLETAMSRGRTLRRRRRAGLAGGAAAGVATAAVVAGIVLGGGSGATPHDVIATDPPPATSSPDDGSFVSGTDHDELVEQVVARHLRSLPRPQDVYPSDWDHAGPMPDADFADATDWQATYTVGAHEDLLLFSGYAPPDEEPDPGCPEEHPSAGELRCVRAPAPGGGWITDDSYGDGDSYVFYSVYVAPSGFNTTVMETVTASSWQQALDRRAFGPHDLHPLLTDPDLVFPLPASRR